MTARTCLATVLLAVTLVGPGPVRAQSAGERAAAQELARLMVDSATRRRIEEQVRLTLMQGLVGTLQTRLNRRLLDLEWDIVERLVRQLVTESLPPDRVEAIAAQIYMNHFSEGELLELLRFQKSDVGRKAAELAPVIAAETTQAIDVQLRDSPATPRVLEQLRQTFPVLGPSESP